MARRARASKENERDLRVWNRTRSKADAWAENGGAAFGTAAQAARGAGSVHLMLSDDAAVDDVLFGASGVVGSLAPSAIVVDHSTVSVEGAARRARQMAERRLAFLQAPVLAGPAAVTAGEGLMMVGGARGTFDREAPVLAQMVGTVWHVGEAERDAASFKLMANSMLLCITEALAEYFDLAQACGIDRERAMTLFDSFDPTRVISVRGPRMAKRDYQPAFQVSIAAKDARLIVEAAASDGADMPAIGVVRRKLESLMARGHGGLDLSALALDDRSA